MNRSDENRKKRRGTLLRLLPYLKDNAGLLSFAVILAVCSNIAALLIPQFSGQAIDAIHGIGDVDFEAVKRDCFFLFGMIVMAFIFSYSSSLVLMKVSSKITKKMRKEIYEHLLELPVSFFDTHAVGDIISRISYDVDTINSSLSSDVITIFNSVITVIGSAVMMIEKCLPLCSIFVLTVPLIIFISKVRAVKVRPLFSKRSKDLGALNGFSEEMLSGLRTIKAYAQEPMMLERFDAFNDEAVSSYYQAEYEGGIIGPTVAFINNLSLALVSMFGALLYLKDVITLGGISSFILYSRKFSGPISESANLFAELQSTLSAADRVFRLLDEPAELQDKEDALVLEQAEGYIDFEDVCFSYVPGKEILHDIDLNASPGQMVAIVGPTGAGKTTIISLLMRFYDPQSGKICLDKTDIRDINRNDLRKQFSMVLQDTWLFAGTIKENVAYGKQDATDEEIIEVCKAAHIHEFIISLEKGYDTPLSDSGVNISKGQKQLLTIARAMLSEAKMLILDEATSNVDSYTEQLIQQAMTHLCKGKTTFIIAHRLSTIQSADKILVLNHGRLIEQGTHEELLAQKGFYASLFNAQWEN